MVSNEIGMGWPWTSVVVLWITGWRRFRPFRKITKQLLDCLLEHTAAIAAHLLLLVRLQHDHILLQHTVDRHRCRVLLHSRRLKDYINIRDHLPVCGLR